MAKARTVYVCDECGSSQPKWMGQCPDCRAWNTLREIRLGKDENPRSTFHATVGAQTPTRLSAVEVGQVPRVPLPIGELNRVLGGGVVPGSLVLIGGEPGIGKSTLILQASAQLADRLGPVLYVSGEESAQQIRLRADRLGLATDDLFLLTETNLDAVLATVDELSPRALVVDSIQAMVLDEIGSTAGSVTQVRECAGRLMRLAKGSGDIPVFLVGHVTKAGHLAGPRVLEHMVDTVLYLEGDRFHDFRLLRCVKNRFGATNEVGVFEMRRDGLAEVANPSEAFLSERLPGVPGSTVTVAMEGTRPLLVEIQALASTTGLETPRRTANGIDFNRLLLLTAVLTRRLGLTLGNQDIFVNVVGGLRIQEPAADLAVAAAIASAARGVALPTDLVIVGEIGLSGELRSVGHIERRLAEASKLGFARALVPSTSRRVEGETPPIKIESARTVAQALVVALAGEPAAAGAD